MKRKFRILITCTSYALVSLITSCSTASFLHRKYTPGSYVEHTGGVLNTGSDSLRANAGASGKKKERAGIVQRHGSVTENTQVSTALFSEKVFLQAEKLKKAVVEMDRTLREAKNKPAEKVKPEETQNRPAVFKRPLWSLQKSGDGVMDYGDRAFKFWVATLIILFLMGLAITLAFLGGNGIGLLTGLFLLLMLFLGGIVIVILDILTVVYATLALVDAHQTGTKVRPRVILALVESLLMIIGLVILFAIVFSPH